MGYRDGIEGYESVSAQRRRAWWPEIDSLVTAREVARKANGGWVFAASLLLGATVLLATHKNPVDLQPAADISVLFIATAIELEFVLFASWRMRRGKGWIVSWLMLALFLLETVSKIATGRFGVFWVVVYFYIAASITAGARACWAIRQRRRQGEQEEDLGEVFA